MILHPQHKLQYFRDENWPEEWITEAIDVLCAEWTEYYKPAPPEVPNESADAPAATSSKGKGKGKAAPPSGPGTGRKSAQASTKKAMTALFASISNGGKGTKDPLEVYLKSPQHPTVKDPLDYWNLRLQLGDPSLARMALD